MPGQFFDKWENEFSGCGRHARDRLPRLELADGAHKGLLAALEQPRKLALQAVEALGNGGGLRGSVGEEGLRVRWEGCGVGTSWGEEEKRRHNEVRRGEEGGDRPCWRQHITAEDGEWDGALPERGGRGRGHRVDPASGDGQRATYPQSCDGESFRVVMHTAARCVRLFPP
jgi:hypothetical protein